jgi:hypothetical protein
VVCPDERGRTERTIGIMDTSNEYIKMCKKAGEIQEYFSLRIKELRPSYIFDYCTGRASLVLWMPKTLSKRTGFPGDEVIISIEQYNDGNILIEPNTLETEKPVIWLPRQDQLQEMIRMTIHKTTGEGPSDFCVVLQDLRDFHEGENFEASKTMEQLWLAFTMKKKFNKTWDGKDWKE